MSTVWFIHVHHGFMLFFLPIIRWLRWSLHIIECLWKVHGRKFDRFEVSFALALSQFEIFHVDVDRRCLLESCSERIG